MRHARAPWRQWLPHGLLLLLVVVLAGCVGSGEGYPQSTLHPKGDFAELVDALFQRTVVWATIIFVLVEGALVWAIWRFRGRPDDPEPAQTHGNTTVEIIWTVIPAAVLAVVAVPTVRTIFETAEIPAATAEGGEPLTVEVVGHQWWWEFRYPSLGITTANELHVPVGRTIDLRMKTVDVLHSFWIPQFAGKRDVFPNRETRLWFTAREAGEFPGACAEFCGLQHGRMLFYVMAADPGTFDAWVTARQADSNAVAMRNVMQPAAPDTAAGALPEDPQVAEGRRLFATKGCVGCHALGSVGAPPVAMGPSLAGIATRKMIGAGWLLNTDDNLAHWIQNPDQFKEGTLMGPAMANARITDAEARALVAFLRTRQ
jgi:cytochrome c oxidase subunit 2